MGFLSGVLEAVKNENEVTTYDKNTTKIGDVINTLTNNIGSGRAGLVDAVAEVKGWLEGYGREVNKKCDDVKTTIKTLENDIPTVVTEIEKLKNENYSDDVLGPWMRSTRTLSSSAYYASDLLVYLDANLKTKITPCVDMIKQAVVTFRSNAKRDRQELATTCSNVQVELSELEREITAFATFQNGRCVDALQEEFDSKIKKPIVTVKAKLEEINSNLEKWSEQAMTVVESALIKCQDILGKVTEKQGGGKPREWNDIENAAKELKKKSDILLGAIKAARLQVNSTVVVALNSVKQMDKALRSDLYRVKKAITTAIWQHVEDTILPQFHTIRDKVGKEDQADQNDEESIDKNWYLLKEQLTGFVNSLTGKPNGTLQAVVDGVKKYAKGFAADAFETTVLTGWISDIVDEEGSNVSNKIFDYIIHSSSMFREKGMGKNTAKANAIRKAISHKLPGFIITDIIMSAQFEKLQDATAKDMGTKLSAFAGRVERELTKDGNSSIMLAVKSIEEMLQHDGVLNLTSSGKDSYLTSAVKAVLKSLANRFKHVAAEIQRFITNSQIDIKLGSAIENVNDIGTQFDAKKDGDEFNVDYGHRVDTALYRVKQAIKPLDTAFTKDSFEGVVGSKLTAEIGQDATHRDNDNTVIINKSKFNTFNTFVDQPVSSMTQPTGKLPTAIKQIGVEVQNELDDIVNPDDAAGTAIDSGILDRALSAITNAISTFVAAVRKLVENGEANGEIRKKGVKQLIIDLQTILGNNSKNLYSLPRGLESIQAEIRMLIGPDTSKSLNTLASLANESTNFYATTMQQRLNECINAINQKVRDEVTDKIKNLKNAALSQFTNRKTAELDALKSLVSTQISAIENIINTDSASGLKGLLKALYGAQYPIPNGSRHSVTDVSSQFNNYLHPIFAHISTEVTTPSPSSQLVADLQSRTYALLTHLHKNQRTFTFDSEFRTRLHSLTSALSTFDPATFANPHHPQLLDALKAGMRGLVKEMEKMYVNRYDGSEGITWTTNKEQKEEPTDDAKRCAKVFMSCLPMWVEDLGELKRRCAEGGSWKGKAIHLKDEINKENPLGEFLKQCGYVVPTSQKSHQDGELQCHKDMKGSHIHAKIIETKISNGGGDVYDHLKGCDSNKDIKTGEPKEETHFDISHILDCLYHHVNKYNDACHLSTLTSKRHPCSVYEMLVWLSGLPHNPVHQGKLNMALMHMMDELYKRGRKDVEEIGNNVQIDIHEDDPIKVFEVGVNDIPLEASPKDVSYERMLEAVTHICATAYDVLCTIAGHGDAYTTYASDFSNNSMKFYYPASGEDCFDMLVNILRRLFPILRFMETQCSDAASGYGWAQCHYGKNIPTTKSRCNDHLTDKPTCQAKCQAECQPNGKANDQPNCQVSCQPTSPLMSYLNDCLPGHLPHNLSKIGCKYECVNCPSTLKKGMPCLTPLGFRGFSGSTRTGREICDIIRKFFSNRNLSALLCLQPTPPSTLAEHFDFVMSLVNKWQSKGPKPLEDKIASSITGMTIDLYTTPTKLKDALSDAYGKSQNRHERTYHFPAYADLCSLSMNTICNEKDIHCAPYLYCLSSDSSYYLAEKHVETYLSWAVYLPWKFHEYLANLFDALKSILCRDWDCRSCLSGDKCRGGQHGLTDEKTKAAYCQCPSVVECNGVLPTIYKFGFTFGQASTLISRNITCTNFCDQLNNVINSKYFTDLFTECDNFLYYIRFPFMSLTLALWLLSLLYLIHIMVIRLDLLHIKSHLHSPSSHRIAAQSLLAAARVNKLNRVFYLQP